ncbi:MAG: ester cyclase [Anaerolineae bacterium]
MSEEKTRAILTRYWESKHADLDVLADNATATLMASGETARGPEAVQDLLDNLYYVAFEADPRPRNTLYADGHAVWEGHLVGRHTGEFAGLPATGKDVCVPLCVVYDLADGHIERTRIYLEMDVLRRQLGLEEKSLDD